MSQFLPGDNFPQADHPIPRAQPDLTVEVGQNVPSPAVLVLPRLADVGESKRTSDLPMA